ncbi:MAG TPA: Ig-like domain-containing protein, partial [Gammaproteobacteria bacterium]|nr:Ig-like domain-containing protein [Gammaproteobacteria bacterium]
LVFELTAPQNQQDATLIVNDVESAPISAPPVALAKDTRAVEKLVANDGAGLPTRAALPLEQVLGGITGRESALTAEVYYRTVDPDSTRYTLDSWLQMAGFASDDRGTLKPEAIAGTGEFAHAIYLNNYDLGFGRNMYTRTDPYGNVYAFVGNYLTLEGAIRAGAPFATVVMEYSPLRAPSDGTQKFVKFFTYVDDGSGDSRRVGSLNFDGRGELFTPGNCLACHGGAKPPGLSELVYDSGCGNTLDAACYSWPAKNRDGVDIADGNLQATFLPWDSGALLFADTDPAITQGPKRFDGLSVADRLRRDYGDYSRAAQEAQIKKLNEAAYATYCNASVVPDCPTDAARRLVEHWYGGLDQDGKLSAAAFDDSEAPIGWRNGETVSTPTSVDPGATAINPDSAEAIYHGVFAHHCRMCHTNITDPALRFDTYQKLKAEAANGDVTEAVFQRGVMPAARLTADRFWVSFAEGTPTAADLLAKEVGFDSPDGQSGPAPKAQITGLGGTVARNASVRFSGADSLFAGAFAWTVEYEPPTLLAGDSDIAAFEPALVGAANSQLAFAAAKPGTYKVHLTIRDKDGAEFAADPVEVDVPDHLPEFGDLTLNIAEGGSETLSVLDELNKLCATAGCPEVFGDSPFSVAVNAAAWQASDGQLTLDDAARGTVTITATQPGPISAALPFTVTDADSETLTAAINVNIVPLSNPTATDDNDTTCAQTTIINDIVSGCAQPSVAVAGTRQVSIDVLANDVSDPAAGALHIDSFTQPAGGSSVGLVFQSGDSLVFRPALGFTGTATFGYVAVDSNTTGGRTSNEAEVSVTVVPTTRFSVEVQGALNGGGCLGCHVASTISTCSPGSEALAPNWQVYSNFKHCVGTPGGARSSSVLTWPLPSNTSHGGYLSVIGTWRESDDKNFRAVLRWIEEGAQDN